MPTFDVQVSADAYGIAQFPYIVSVDAVVVGEQFLTWPAGLFKIEDGASFTWSVGAHDQMIGGERQRIQTAGKWAEVSTRMIWWGADAVTMRAWLLAAQASAWVVNNPPLWGSPALAYGRWSRRVEMTTEPGILSADIVAVLSWE